MNILVFSWRDIKHPLAGGAEQVMHEHMKGWIAGGHLVTFFSSSFPNAKNEEVIDGVKIIRKGSQYLSCHIYAFFWYLFSNHNKFDLVVDEFHGWPFFTPFYVFGTKTLAVIQEMTKEVWFKYPLPYGLNYILGVIGYILEPLFFLPYRRTHFMTGSESAKKELISVGIKDKMIDVVSHGVILDLPKRIPLKEKIKTVIFLGALAKDKGIEDAIRCFSVMDSKMACKFWVVGGGDRDYLKFLEGLAKGLGVEIIFFGGRDKVNDRRKFELLSRAHIMINPSVREGWGLVNIEANSVGTPIVAYNSVGLIDSVKNGFSGIICKKNSPEAMASEVLEIFKDERKYKKLSRNAILWSKSFSWEKSKKQSLSLIEKTGLR